VELVGSQPGEELDLEVGHHPVGIGEPVVAARRDLDDVATAVTGVAAPFGEAVALELIEQGDQLARVEIERVGELLLTDRPEIAEAHQGECLGSLESGRLERVGEAPLCNPP